ncbi:hypothetical protein CU102_07120 [Phyllobacterium brassicacearum]|uniref:Uncharacterized protein n=2 Tax=Phyllobacterium brassicacearum TaxID=314235 RepID=A0A2P7BSW6_9HYPH|nr:hypothetical protein CU102_07120 [Phyllobacterium brassicacearum]
MFATAAWFRFMATACPCDPHYSFIAAGNVSGPTLAETDVVRIAAPACMSCEDAVHLAFMFKT